MLRHQSARLYTSIYELIDAHCVTESERLILTRMSKTFDTPSSEYGAGVTTLYSLLDKIEQAFRHC